jgi:probable phosphomutase (TIGR03848 family)
LDDKKPQFTLLLLIRHAANDWVGNNKLAGWTPGVHLNDEGNQQANVLAQRLAGLPVAAVYSSPLERALETARPLAATKDLPVQIRDRLGEVKYGEWTGQKLEDLAKTDLWKVVQLHPSGARFPGGEAIHEMQARAVAELEAICHAHPDAIVAVVSHADVIKAVVAHYVGMHLDLFQRLAVSPASVTAIAVAPTGARLITFNDIGSLDYLARHPDDDEGQAEATRDGQGPGDGEQKDQSDA